jgi:hypothetical protein
LFSFYCFLLGFGPGRRAIQNHFHFSAKGEFVAGRDHDQVALSTILAGTVDFKISATFKNVIAKITFALADRATQFIINANQNNLRLFCQIRHGKYLPLVPDLVKTKIIRFFYYKHNFDLLNQYNKKSSRAKARGDFLIFHDIAELLGGARRGSGRRWLAALGRGTLALLTAIARSSRRGSTNRRWTQRNALRCNTPIGVRAARNHHR